MQGNLGQAWACLCPLKMSFIFWHLTNLLFFFFLQKQVYVSTPKQWHSSVYSCLPYLFFGGQVLAHLFKMLIIKLYLIFQKGQNGPVVVHSFVVAYWIYVDLAGRGGICLVNLFFHLLFFFSCIPHPCHSDAAVAFVLGEEFIDGVSGHNRKRSWANLAVIQ